jgi:hypothetical protein
MNKLLNKAKKSKMRVEVFSLSENPWTEIDIGQRSEYQKI